jgi:hypothetical protein
MQKRAPRDAIAIGGRQSNFHTFSLGPLDLPYREKWG